MNLINQIESALKAINQAKFQDLINHLLHVQGYKFIGAPGSVVGKEKTSKGAPDSFFVNDDKYIFVECTTQERLGESKTFIDKLLKDVDHCFDEVKTGIDKSKIEMIILACNEKLSASEHQSLKERVSSFNRAAQLLLYDIQNLPMHIYDFPGLSEQYVGVTTVKGEIYNLPDYLLKTTKGLQPSLVNPFVGRNDELEKAVADLKTIDIMLLSGVAGVGKSKLAIAILEVMSETGFIPIVIQSSAVPLWDDFVHLFQSGKDYIILFDDANKSVQNLSYLLNFIQKPRTNKLKVVITSRDYVKQQVIEKLNNALYNEIVIGTFKDEQIEKIICEALPNLGHYPDIKTKIIEVAKGNARVALMATYSVTPDSKVRYLDSPVKLYEQYFEKIAGEIDIFSKPIMLQALAIISFFSVLDRNDENLRTILANDFNIEWDELWGAVFELHEHEIVDVYASEVVKVSNQVLATYAFYKCFIDSKTVKIDYSRWISGFMVKYFNRIKSTLIDVNNTFNYVHIKELVLPHLQNVLSTQQDENALYTFHSLFWFYKEYDTLVFLKKWIADLPSEMADASIKFEYVHNDHTHAGRYFELLVNFWNNRTELLKPSIELGLELANKQPGRIPAILKFIHDHFSYRIEDTRTGYERQEVLFDVLLDVNLTGQKKEIANGISLNVMSYLLGWHFTEFAPLKGMSISMRNFNLVYSEELLKLRRRMLETFFILFGESVQQTNAILNKITYPQGEVDKEVYKAELPYYKKLIAEKLSIRRYADCKFVKRISKLIFDTKEEVPAEWVAFTESNIIKLAAFLEMHWDDDAIKNNNQKQIDQQTAFTNFIHAKNWSEIEQLLHDVNDMYQQFDNNSGWFIPNGTARIFHEIALKSKAEFIKALHFYFSGPFSMPLNIEVFYFALGKGVITGKELLDILMGIEFPGREFWISVVLAALPAEQVDKDMVVLLIKTFTDSTKQVSVNAMISYEKFQPAFELYKNESAVLKDSNHNIISLLTEILLSKRDLYHVHFGTHFCRDCAKYFVNHVHLLKQVYIAMVQVYDHFDYDGIEIKAVLELDNYFFVEYLKQKKVDENYLNLKLEDFKLDSIWALPKYKEVVKKSLAVILAKCPISSNFSHVATVLFEFKKPDTELLEKVKAFIEEFIRENASSELEIVMIMNIVMHKFNSHFVPFLKQFLLQNKDVELFKEIELSAGGAFSGSLVPHIQSKMDFCKTIINMVKSLPNVLDYAKHIEYMEQLSNWLKQDMTREQKREFQEVWD